MYIACLNLVSRAYLFTDRRGMFHSLDMNQNIICVVLIENKLPAVCPDLGYICLDLIDFFR